jgi:hypothetical protein
MATGAGGWYRYVTGLLPTPGVGNQLLQSNRQFCWNIIGSGIGQRRQFRMFVPQNLQGVAVVPQTGLGGLASGQVVMQPLSNPYESV